MSLFTELGLSQEIVKAVAEKGFETPSPVQEKSIPELLKGNQDFVGLAQTGTGKTAAFGLPLLDLIDNGNRDTQALILAPTRELSNQIAKDLMVFSKYKFTKIVPVFGGASIQTQITQIKRGAQIIVATPGRLLDLISRRVVDISLIKYVVLDEADEMLNMGFYEDLKKILASTPDDKKTWLFSATMPKEIRAIASKFMTDPFEITCGTANTTNENIEHQFYPVKGRDKYAALKRIVDFYPEIFGIIFCRTKSETQRVSDMLSADGYDADSLHGDLSQAQRDRVMANFKKRNLQMLVATDVAARGIDVDNITHVINYGLPDDIESYTHRSGRTARAGKKGISICIVDSRDLGKVKQIERIVKTKFERKMVPTVESLCERQMSFSLNKLKDVEVDESKIASYQEVIEESFKDLTKEEIIKKVASAELNRFFEYYSRSSQDININDGELKHGMRDSKRSERGERGDRRGGDRNPDEDRLFINLGRSDGMKRKDIMQLVVDLSGVDQRSIGDIDDKGAFSFVQIKKENTEKVLTAFRNSEHEGKRLRVEVTKGEPRSGGGNRGGGYRGGNKGNFRGDRDRRSSGGDRDRNRGGGQRKDWGRSDDRGNRNSGGGDRKDRNLSDLFSEPSNF